MDLLDDALALALRQVGHRITILLMIAEVLADPEHHSLVEAEHLRHAGWLIVKQVQLQMIELGRDESYSTLEKGVCGATDLDRGEERGVLHSQDCLEVFALLFWHQAVEVAGLE